MLHFLRVWVPLRQNSSTQLSACDEGKKQDVLKLISRLKENKRLKLSCGGPEQCQKIYLLYPQTRKVNLAYKAPDLSRRSSQTDIQNEQEQKTWEDHFPPHDG